VKKKPKTKSKAVRNLPAKGLAAKASKGVKGGFLLGDVAAPAGYEGPGDKWGINYDKINPPYTSQDPGISSPPPPIRKKW